MSLKTLRFFLFVVLVGFMASCIDVGGSKDEDPVPGEPLISLVVNGSGSVTDFTAEVGDTIVIEGTATAGSIIRRFEGTVTFGELDNSLVLFEGDSASTEFVIDPIKYVIPFTASGASILFTFALSDLEEVKDSVAFEVTVDESPILEVTERFLGGYGHATYGNLLNMLEDTVYFPNNVRTSEANQEGLDLIVSYDVDAGWMLSAPDNVDAPAIWDANVNFNWPFFVQNSTRLKTLPGGFDYDGIQTSVQLDDVFTGDGSSSVSSLTAGQVLAIRLDRDKQSKVGVIKILSIVVGKADVRQVTVAYKIQK